MISSVLEAIRGTCLLASNAEVSIEVNPTVVETSKLRCLPLNILVPHLCTHKMVRRKSTGGAIVFVVLTSRVYSL